MNDLRPALSWATVSSIRGAPVPEKLRSVERTCGLRIAHDERGGGIDGDRNMPEVASGVFTRATSKARHSGLAGAVL
ncbi:hypothetical protein [Actinomadura rubrisoli]|uniref:Uncharacterized protein n=1 Tax=Actinomadura rubrisoli TaxID=2530368 RepID=A0A4R5BSI7_9ACTN|nr:hypothetical protein [Actinomadura rubrisoli]TDD87112.1 hypothetical protein E1298_16605 [Actinomadura rubrisoli]